MKQLIFFTIFNFLFLVPCSAQENNLCPTAKFVLPVELTPIGEKMPFAVSLSEESKNLNLKYDWTISEGEIAEGQGTNSIKVQTTNELAGKEILAIVQIKGLNDICKSVFYEKAFVAPPIADPIYDIYEVNSKQNSIWEEQALIDNILHVLSNNPDSVIIFFLNLKSPTKTQINYRIERILKAFARRKEPFENKGIFVVKKSERNFNAISIAPKGILESFVRINDDDLVEIIKSLYLTSKKSPKRK